MTLTPEHREALIAEAVRWAKTVDGPWSLQDAASHTLDLIEAGWKPEPKVDAETLACREAIKGSNPPLTVEDIAEVDAGRWDDFPEANIARHAYRAGLAKGKADAEAEQNTADAEAFLAQKPEPKPSKALLATREALKRTYYHYSDNIDAGRWDGSEMAKIPRHAYNLGRESALGEGAREVIFDAMAKHSPGTLSKQADAILTALRERE